MRALIVAVVLVGRVAAADGVWGVEAPFALGTAAEQGPHATVGGHLGASYATDRVLLVGGGAEWTLIPGVGTMPQAWLTTGLALPSRGVIVAYAGPSLRFYDLLADRDSGARFALAGELGVRALLLHRHSRGKPVSVGVYLRGDAPLVGGIPWTASLCLVVGPEMPL
ncbi:MAG TPA: hypothetical protein VLX92_03180 [Kofleriaceae bacterium]|nr:hypothetical protein [Kofleriaceae bacterium]